MNENAENRIEKYNLRARFPGLLRAGAIAVLAAVVLVVVIGFYFGSFRKEFRMRGLPAVLSDNVVAVVEGYERKESEDSKLRYSIKASRATTFDDKHQELLDVVLEVYDESGAGRFDKLKADKAIYVPDEKDSKDFNIFFAGNVIIDTRDRLNIKTDQLSYSKSEEKAEAEEYVEFARENLSGNSEGAVVRIEAKTLELLKDVEIFAEQGGEGTEYQTKDIKTAELRAGRAFVDQTAQTIDLTGSVDALLIPSGANKNLERPTRITSSKAKAFLEDRQLRRIDLMGDASMKQEPGGRGRNTNATADRITAYIEKELDRIEMSGSVKVDSSADSGSPTKITSVTAVYDKPGETFELDGGVVIESTSSGKPTTAKASHAVYGQVSGEVLLTGSASVAQGSDIVGGETIAALLYPDRTLKNADVSGKAYLRQTATDRKTELRSQELRASFSRGGKIAKAFATGGSIIEVIPSDNPDYSKYSLKTPSIIEVLFREDGKPASAKTEGRTTISLTSSGAGSDAADKTLTADTVSTSFRKGSDELEGAVASGNAVLVSDPRSKGPGKYRTEIKSPKFTCDFYAGNNAKSCTTSGARSNAVRNPLGSSDKDAQTLEADRFVAFFESRTQDIERLEASGSAKFREGERNGIADNIVYTARGETVRLSGGDPAVWDDAGRVRAGRIDWDLKNDRSSFSDKVSATYYSQRKARGATPFAKVNSPVFVSSSSAAFDHKQETAVFSGDARAWQDKNYVRGEKITLEQQTGRFAAEGNVRSLLYDAKRSAGGKRSSVPVYAQSDAMQYVNDERRLRYTGNVDIRQGTDRITAGTAVVYLDAANELKKTVAEKKVVITQPGRKATGEFAQYDAAEETIILRGDPATVKDDESGSSEGREVLVRLKDNVIVGTGKSGDKGTGRMRSVYKLKDGKLN